MRTTNLCYTLVGIVIVVVLIGCSAGGESCSPTPEPSKTITLYHFRIVDASVAPGYCGMLAEGFSDSTSTQLVQLKVINLPAQFLKLPPLFVSYVGTFEVFGETHLCIDGRPDPMPGKEPTQSKPRYANILTYELEPE